MGLLTQQRLILWNGLAGCSYRSCCTDVDHRLVKDLQVLQVLVRATVQRLALTGRAFELR